MSDPASGTRRTHRLTAEPTPLPVILATWQDVLHRADVRGDANPFELGATSMDVLRVKSRLDTALGTNIPVVDFFRYPTPTALARHLQQTGNDHS